MSEPSVKIRLGTRASALAVAQSEWVAATLRALSPRLDVELVRIRTSGDRILDRSLAEIGGKGLFVKEIEEALLEDRIDFAVHSMKDVPVALAAGLAIVAVPKREDPRDALIAGEARHLAELREGARVGTSSLRRRVFVKHRRPDLEVVPLRGNVDTRIAKWRNGEIDAVVLACAGLRRLGLTLAEAAPLGVDEMVPAIGQGALAIEARLDSGFWDELARLGDADTTRAIEAERGFLGALGGDCTTPVAGHAVVDRGTIRLVAAIGDPEGRELVEGSLEGEASAAAKLGAALAADLLARGGRRILDGLRR